MLLRDRGEFSEHDDREEVGIERAFYTFSVNCRNKQTKQTYQRKRNKTKQNKNK